jgi:glucoamylase
VRPLIKTIENFASEGGMLPEQIWDEPDKGGLIFGEPAGAAMPLVWAHAEYVKLLRSVTDGKVFDRIPIVAERYAENGKRESQIEVFKLRRKINSIPVGKTLRITAHDRFKVLWTANGWKTNQTMESSTVGFAGSFADIPTTPEQTGAVSFTLFWIEENRWEGRNFDVEIEAAS